MSQDIERAVQAFRDLRAKKEEIVDRHKEELAPINEAMFKLQSWMQAKLLQDGAESIKTAAGTCYLQKSNSVTVADKGAFFEYLHDNDAWEFADIRAAKGAVVDLVESTGDIPPGVKFSSEIVCRVRAR